MSKPKSAQTAPKSAKPDLQDRVYPREMYNYCRNRLKLRFTDAMWSRIDAAITEGRILFGYAKSGNGTKGTDEPDKVGTVERDEHDTSKLVAVVSAVKADVEPITVLGRFLHAFIAIGGYEHDPDSPRIFTKEGFGENCRAIGLEQMPYSDPARKPPSPQAYGRYFKPGAFILQKVQEHGAPPKAPFSIAGTAAAATKRTFNLKAYDPEHGPDAFGFFPVLNPAKTDGDAPVTTEAAEAHAKKYGHLVFFNVSRDDHGTALKFYRTEADIVAEVQNLTPTPDLVEEPKEAEQAELAV
jgi:hypothetical protein